MASANGRGTTEWFRVCRTLQSCKGTNKKQNKYKHQRPFTIQSSQASEKQLQSLSGRMHEQFDSTRAESEKHLVQDKQSYVQ